MGLGRPLHSLPASHFRNTDTVGRRAATPSGETQERQRPELLNARGLGTTGFSNTPGNRKLLEGLGPGAWLLPRGSGGRKDSGCFQSPGGEEQEQEEPQLQRTPRVPSQERRPGQRWFKATDFLLLPEHKPRAPQPGRAQRGEGTVSENPAHGGGCPANRGRKRGHARQRAGWHRHLGLHSVRVTTLRHRNSSGNMGSPKPPTCT